MAYQTDKRQSGGTKLLLTLLQIHSGKHLLLSKVNSPRHSRICHFSWHLFLLALKLFTELLNRLIRPRDITYVAKLMGFTE